METSYLKVRPLGNRYPEWTPNLLSDRSQDWNPCARGSQGLQSTAVPLYHGGEGEGKCMDSRKR